MANRAADPKLAASLPTAEAEARRAEQRRAEIKTALYSLAPLNAIPVRLNSDFVSVDRGVTRLVVSGRIDMAPVPFVKVRDHHQTVLEAVAVVCDEAGAVVKTLPTDRTLRPATEPPTPPPPPSTGRRDPLAQIATLLGPTDD